MGVVGELFGLHGLSWELSGNCSGRVQEVTSHEPCL